MILLAIDPGPVESAWLTFDLDTGTPYAWAKAPNEDVLALVTGPPYDVLAIEMIASYGMPVGAEVFETCVWIGRFMQAASRMVGQCIVRPTRIECKSHLCHSAKATDANIRQALIDKFGPGKDKAIGKKATPGPLYGLSKDGWSALAVAVTVAETRLAA